MNESIVYKTIIETKECYFSSQHEMKPASCNYFPEACLCQLLFSFTYTNTHKHTSYDMFHPLAIKTWNIYQKDSFLPQHFACFHLLAIKKFHMRHNVMITGRYGHFIYFNLEYNCTQNLWSVYNDQLKGTFLTISVGTHEMTVSSALISTFPV